MLLKKNAHILKMLGFDMFIIEFGPVGVFLLVNYLVNFITAALALAIATVVAMLLSKIVNKRVPWFAIFSGVVTIITAFVTYWYNAPWVLIFKDTVYYALFAIILTISLRSTQTIFEKFFGHVFALTKTGWKVLEQRWRIFLVLAAVMNEYVRIFLTVDEWIIYKQIILVVFFLFGMYQLRISSKYRTEEADKWGFRKFKSQQ